MRREEEEQFRDFAASRARSLRRTAYLLCGDWHLAEDLAQSTLIKMYRHWPRLTRRDQLDAYARRVLLRAWLDERRRPWRRSEDSYDTVPDTPDEAAGPEALAHRLELGNAVHRALLTLPPRQRATIVLRYVEDLSVADTARALGCSAGTVKSQCARALDALRRTIGEADDGEDPVADPEMTASTGARR